jgi:hypothetical protein
MGQESRVATRRIFTLLATALIASAAGACASVGPNTVARDRIDYATAIGESWKQQTLLNVVKLRYGDVPIFLDIAQVIAGYQIESGVIAGFNAASDDAGGPFAFGGSATATSKYTDRPTLIYAPLTGTDFLTKLTTPMPPRALLFVLQSGYAADIALPLTVNSVNGVSNESRRGMSRPADPQFHRLAQLLRELQLADLFQIRIERPNTGSETNILVFPPVADPQSAAKFEEIGRILRLKPGLREYAVRYGGYSGRDDEISIMTRSMLQIMLELAADVEVPVSDVAAGKATPGSVDVESATPRPPSLLKIAGGDAPPQDAHVAVRYKGRWFWIANTDIRSKNVFAFVMFLFSIADTGLKSSAPVVTVPAN